MKVVTLAVGAPKAPGLAESIADYESRIAHYFNFEAIEVRGERLKPGGGPGDAPDRESDALLARVPGGLEVVALDRRGTRWSSEELAAYLAELAVLGRSGVAFLIGGPVGLSSRALEKADRVLCLSSFTLPHEMARLLLAEQIYRSGTINRGEPYHRSG